MNHFTFTIGELTCRIGDNSEYPGHDAGANGIQRLRSVHDDSDLFVPYRSGCNFQHIFDGDNYDDAWTFEPRNAPMEFKYLAENECELYQPPTPNWGLESWTNYTILDPYYIDIKFKCRPHKDIFKFGYLGIFWSSYMNGPENKNIHFWSYEPIMKKHHWMSFGTQFHNRDSSVRSIKCNYDLKVREIENNLRLYASISPARYYLPFFFGRNREMVYALLFPEEREEHIRFAHSPLGGAFHKYPDFLNPAWDFHYIIPDYRVGETYTINYRVVYKKFDGREDIREEYEQWKNSRYDIKE